MALRQSPAAFLVESDEAAVVAQIVRNQERCPHVLFFLQALREQSWVVDATGET